MRHFVPSKIQISDFYCFCTIYKSYDIGSIYRHYINKREKKYNNT